MTFENRVRGFLEKLEKVGSPGAVVSREETRQEVVAPRHKREPARTVEVKVLIRERLPERERKVLRQEKREHRKGARKAYRELSREDRRALSLLARAGLSGTSVTEVAAIMRPQDTSALRVSPRIIQEALDRAKTEGIDLETILPRQRERIVEDQETVERRKLAMRGGLRAGPVARRAASRRVEASETQPADQ